MPVEFVQMVLSEAAEVEERGESIATTLPSSPTGAKQESKSTP